MTNKELEEIGDALLKAAHQFDELEITLAEASIQVAKIRASYEKAVALVMAQVYGHENQ